MSTRTDRTAAPAAPARGGRKRLAVEWEDGMPDEEEWIRVYRGLVEGGASGVRLDAAMPSGMAACHAVRGWPANRPGSFVFEVAADKAEEQA